VTIGQWQLGFGIHTITLLVTDSSKAVGRDDIKVDVRDTKPPSLTIPADIVMFRTKGARGGVKVDLGKAYAGDSCSDKVTITNNAPRGMLFPSGRTEVTWVADDGRGNQTRKVQKVNIISLEKDTTRKIKEGMLELAEAATKAANMVQECREQIICTADINPLLQSVQQIRKALKEEGSGESQPLPHIDGPLSEVVVSLEKAESFLRQSNEVEGNKELRSTTLQQIVIARNLLLKLEREIK
jgi:hypothetical protein